MTALRGVAKVVLVLVTLVFLASMGGGMLFVWWLLVPLHWLAAQRSGPWGTAGWALLAGASMSEVTWMALYTLSGQNLGVAYVSMIVGFVVPSVLFVWARSRYPLRSSTIRSSPSPGS